mmetsp:Transcript_50552/g.119612  ORF Transcript_50552/g.119612 Transcript_50552/m.119612 type:complete len:117 (+) Transcript_50552:31-381(+)
MNRIAAAAQRTTRVVRPMAQNARAVAKRNMSAHGHHDPNDMTWRNVSVVGTGMMLVLAAYQYRIHLDHLAHPGYKRSENNNRFAYMDNRKKAFPWVCSDCGLFDGECWKQCKAEGK